MRLLDLFCGAGGAAMGYYRAGFTEIVGVDIKPKPHYPFEFVLGDALEYVANHGREFDLIHASPPCQGYSVMRHLPWLKDNIYPLLIPAARLALNETGVDWVIENVVTAPLNGGVLCGAALGLPIVRHRRFESNRLLLFPSCPGHETILAGRRTMSARSQTHGVMGIAVGDDPRRATEIDWMTNRELRQAIPPAYTEFIGKQLRGNL